MNLMGEITLSLRGSVVLAIALVIVAAAAAFAFYRFTLPPLPPRQRYMLSTLRAISLACILLLFFEPIIRIVHRNELPPRVAVLLDNSQSAGMTDNAMNRSDAMRKWMKSSPLSGLPSPAVPFYYGFAGKITMQSDTPPDTISFSGQSTDISAALGTIKERQQKDNIQAVVLVTDGNYTTGKNPLYDAQAMGLPVFTVGLGDTAEQKDVLVEKVLTNAIAFAESRVPVEATIKSSGYNGENVEVTLSEGQTVVDTKHVVLGEGTREYPVELFAEPKEEGMKRYVVTVSHLAGELTEKNNTHSFFIKVLKSKLRVAILAGAPSPDLAAVRQALTEDGHFTVESFPEKSATDFYGAHLARPALDSADCIVFVGFPSAVTGGAVLQLVHDALSAAGKPLLFINSRTTDYSKLSTFESFLPFTWSGITQSEMAVFASVAPAMSAHPLVTLEGSMTADSWKALPPVFMTTTQFRAKPDAQTLAFAELQSSVLPEPLILLHDRNHQKTLAVTGEGVWQWHLMAQGTAQTEKFFPDFISNSVRWLTTKDDDKRVKIAPVRQAFTTAEPVEFSAQVYDEQMNPFDNAEVAVEISKGADHIHLALQATGNGLYSGAAEGLGEGEYSYSGRATGNGKSFGDDNGKFSVGEVNAEFIETRMNKQLLDQIAFRTGGNYYDIGNASMLAADIARKVSFSSKELVEANEIELWNWRYFLGVLVAALGVEWLMRKLYGML
jgi:hypothetical protein